jgi:hypothetical protein
VSPTVFRYDLRSQVVHEDDAIVQRRGEGALLPSWATCWLDCLAVVIVGVVDRIEGTIRCG